MRDKLRKEKRGSKGWWRVADRIMEKHAGQEAIPALRNSDAIWVRDPVGKANLLARTFSNKFTLPDVVVNEFSFDRTTSVTDEFILVRKSHVCKTLGKMDIYSGTVPDLLACRVFVECSRELSMPLAKLIRRIIALGFWPTELTIH